MNMSKNNTCSVLVNKGKHFFKLVGICIIVFIFMIRKTLICAFIMLALIIFPYLGISYFRGIVNFPNYEWDFSITFFEFLVGSSAFISAIAIISGGVKWLINKLNKNTTTIKSFQPYIRIGDTTIYHQIKSQREFSQFIMEAPLEILQISSVTYFVRFNSLDKNENKILYESHCKPRFGLDFIIKAEKENIVDTFSKRLKRTKSYLFDTKKYEEYITRDTSINNNGDCLHRLEHEIPLDPLLFLTFYKSISIIVKIENSNKSRTAWYSDKLIIEKGALDKILEKISKHNINKSTNDFVNTWYEGFQKKNEKKYSFFEQK